jgi:hypothetical protein
MNDDSPIARKSDPISSKLAATEITANGTREAQQGYTVAAVRAFPGRTSQELADAARHDRYTLARRLPEVERLSLVHRGPTRRCSITGKTALTWFPGPAPATVDALEQECEA